MSVYIKKRWWKFLLLIGAVLISAVSMYYTNILVKKVAQEERRKVEIWANAYREFSRKDLSGVNLPFITEIIQRNESIPLIVVDNKGNIIYHRNLKPRFSKNEKLLLKKLRKIQAGQTPIEFIVSEDETHLVYYEDSDLLKQLQYFPYAQLLVIIIFILVAYYAFNASRQAEQNQVWVGMAKETAHQLGTPISSLLAWVELMKMKEMDASVAGELNKDAMRLKKIAERFSKIGSRAELMPANINEVLENAVEYLKVRSSDKIKYVLDFDKTQLSFLPLNEALFEWVIENICKNAMDAMEGRGTITISMQHNSKHTTIDISDTGRGIPKSKLRAIFKPGYTTKMRGWGLGLSLSKRIINNYHRGRLFVKSSELKKGTTFRIVLKRGYS